MNLEIEVLPVAAEARHKSNFDGERRRVQERKLRGIWRWNDCEGYCEESQALPNRAGTATVINYIWTTI